MSALDEIQVGDQVVIATRHHMFLRTVEKATKTHLVVNGQKYRRSNGCRVGDGAWDHNCVYPANDEWLAKYERFRFESNVKSSCRILADLLVPARVDVHGPLLADIQKLIAAIQEAGRD